MPAYKLYYFDLKALAEPIRFLLAYGKVDYEDVRVARENWPELKPSMPMGQMPVLEVDGKRVHQHISICRYLAKQFGLAGANDWESLLVDIAVDTLNDFRTKLSAYYYETDEAVKAKKLAVVEAETLPFYMQKLEEITKENNGYFALGKLTWADLYFAGIIDMLNFRLGRDLTEGYPHVKKAWENAVAVPEIKAWIAKRPVSDI